jgi:hypothetical protein
MDIIDGINDTVHLLGNWRAAKVYEQYDQSNTLVFCKKKIEEGESLRDSLYKERPLPSLDGEQVFV